jgi:hypothetical protein
MTKSKRGAPKKNRNAAKPESLVASSILHIRCTPAQKARWKMLAENTGKKLSQWVIEKLP